jgi:hypothetical protein
VSGLLCKLLSRFPLSLWTQWTNRAMIPCLGAGQPHEGTVPPSVRLPSVQSLPALLPAPRPTKPVDGGYSSQQPFSTATNEPGDFSARPCFDPLGYT